MTAPRNPDDLIRAFLGEGETDLPDRAFDAVRAGIHQTHQRVVIVPWRFPDMSIFARVAIAAVAVLAVGLAWFNFGPGQPGFGAQPTPRPSPTASPRALTEEFVPLEAGRYVAADPFIVRVTATVPDGWEGGIGGEYFAGLNPVGGKGGLDFMAIGTLYKDPCHFDKGLNDPSQDPVPTLATRELDLAYGLANLGALDTSAPTAVKVAGYSGTEVTITAPASFDGCTLSPNGFAVGQLPLGADVLMNVGETFRLLILDVNGSQLVINVRRLPGSTPQEAAEIQTVLNSIRIEPAH